VPLVARLERPDDGGFWVYVEGGKLLAHEGGVAKVVGGESAGWDLEGTVETTGILGE